MRVEYRELSADDDFDQVGELQRRVFGFSDLELVSPLMLRLVARNNPPLGLHLGAFVVDETQSKLVGAALGFATFLEKSVYIALLGVLPEYQEGPFGFRLLQQFRLACLSKGITSASGVYDAMAANLARLYVGGVGFIGRQFFADKILFQWDFLAPHTVAKMDKGLRVKGLDPFDPRPKATSAALPGSAEVLFEIRGSSPEDLEEARMVLTELLNRRGYTIIDCHSSKVEGERRTYYVLRQPH